MNLWIANAAEQLIAEWNDIQWKGEVAGDAVRNKFTTETLMERYKAVDDAKKGVVMERISAIIERHYEDHCEGSAWAGARPNEPRAILVCQLCGSFIEPSGVHRCKPSHSE